MGMSRYTLQIRLMVEEGLNCLPSYKRTVVTPTGELHPLQPSASELGGQACVHVRSGTPCVCVRACVRACVRYVLGMTVCFVCSCDWRLQPLGAVGLVPVPEPVWWSGPGTVTGLARGTGTGARLVG